MDEQVRLVLFQIAGFLNILPTMRQDIVEKERQELLNKIGELLDS